MVRMYHITQQQFEDIVGEAIDAIPDKYYRHINNVAFVTEDEPSTEQRQKLQLRADQSLFGLYEGIPITHRNNGYNLVLPDKITIFKKPIELAVTIYRASKTKLVRPSGTKWHTTTD